MNVIKIYPPDHAAPVLKAILDPVRPRLEARQNLKVVHSNAQSIPPRQSGYDGEWSEYEAEAEMLDRQNGELVDAVNASAVLSREQITEIRGLRKDIQDMTAVQQELLLQMKVQVNI